MLKKYKTIYIATMIPSVIIFCISVIILILMEVLKLETTVWVAIDIITIGVSGVMVVFSPQIIQGRLVNEVFYDSNIVKVRIDLEELRKNEEFFSVTESKIFQMANNSNNCNLHKYNLRGNMYRLEIICQDDGEFDYCTIYDSFRNSDCYWLLKYSKYFEVI